MSRSEMFFLTEFAFRLGSWTAAFSLMLQVAPRQPIPALCLQHLGVVFELLMQWHSFPQSNFLLSYPFVVLLFPFDVFLPQVVDGCLLERYSTIRSTVFLFVTSSSTLFQPIIAAPYLTTTTAQGLMAIIKLRLLSLDFNNICVHV